MFFVYFCTLPIAWTKKGSQLVVDFSCSTHILQLLYLTYYSFFICLIKSISFEIYPGHTTPLTSNSLTPLIYIYLGNSTLTLFLWAVVDKLPQNDYLFNLSRTAGTRKVPYFNGFCASYVSFLDIKHTVSTFPWTLILYCIAKVCNRFSKWVRNFPIFPWLFVIFCFGK